MQHADVDTVLQQVPDASREAAVRALEAARGDPVAAVCALLSPAAAAPPSGLSPLAAPPPSPPPDMSAPSPETFAYLRACYDRMDAARMRLADADPSGI